VLSSEENCSRRYPQRNDERLILMTISLLYTQGFAGALDGGLAGALAGTLTACFGLFDLFLTHALLIFFQHMTHVGIYKIFLIIFGTLEIL
jgi:hypothetical protein